MRSAPRAAWICDKDQQEFAKARISMPTVYLIVPGFGLWHNAGR